MYKLCEINVIQVSTILNVTDFMLFGTYASPLPSSGINNEYLNKNDDIYKPQVSVHIKPIVILE